MAKISMIGLDLAKNMFQVHGVDEAGQPVVRKGLRRAQLLPFFDRLERCIVGMEACGSAHYWARELMKLGHEVRVMPAAYVKPYVKRNKTDGRDAEAICEAMQRPTMRFVAVKNEQQQAVQVLHRTRGLLVRQRTMAANALRAALAEFGIVAAQGVKGVRTLIEWLDAADCLLPQPAREAFSVLAQHWQALDGDIGALERRIVQAARADAAARRLMQVPCIGPIIASALVAAVPDAGVFRTARGFAAWLGLTPRQNGSGGKQRSGGISKQGNRHLRSLLITGASAQLRYARTRGSKDPWVSELLGRRPYKVVAVALAAKTARIAWALLAKGQDYRAPVPAAA